MLLTTLWRMEQVTSEHNCLYILGKWRNHPWLFYNAGGPSLVNRGGVQQKPEPGGLAHRKEMVMGWTGLETHSCITCTGAREAEITATTQRGKFLSRRRLARKRRGTLADEERSGSTKVDRFSSQLHIVSSVGNDNNVSIGWTNWTLGTLENDRNGASSL